MTVQQQPYTVHVEVTLRANVHDPQGDLIARTLDRLGLGPVSGLRVGKLFTFQIQANDSDDALAQAEAIAGQVLANPQLECYHCAVSSATGTLPHFPS